MDFLEQAQALQALHAGLHWSLENKCREVLTPKGWSVESFDGQIFCLRAANEYTGNKSDTVCFIPSGYNLAQLSAFVDGLLWLVENTTTTFYYSFDEDVVRVTSVLALNGRRVEETVFEACNECDHLLLFIERLRNLGGE